MLGVSASVFILSQGTDIVPPKKTLTCASIKINNGIKHSRHTPSSLHDSDWLIDRRHCDSKWHGQLHEVRERLDEALKQISDLKQLTWISEQPCEYKNYGQLLLVTSMHA